MTNGLPENFTERWIRVENNVEHMAKKLGKIEPADIDNLKSDMALIKRVGGIIVAGVTTGFFLAWKKISNGGG